MPQIFFFLSRNATHRSHFGHTLVLYSKTQYSYSLQCPLARVLRFRRSWNTGSYVTLWSGCIGWSFPSFSFTISVLYGLTREHSRRVTKRLGITHGTALCTTIQSTTPNLKLSNARENQDHLPKQLSLLLSLGAQHAWWAGKLWCAKRRKKGEENRMESLELAFVCVCAIRPFEACSAWRVLSPSRQPQQVEPEGGMEGCGREDRKCTHSCSQENRWSASIPFVRGQRKELKFCNSGQRTGSESDVCSVWESPDKDSSLFNQISTALFLWLHKDILQLK